MRKILISLMLAGLLTMATVVPAFADPGGSGYGYDDGTHGGHGG